MKKLVEDNQVKEDNWVLLEKTESPEEQTIPEGSVIIPLATWLVKRDSLMGRRDSVGVWLDSDEEPEAIAEDVKLFPVIAINFPKFSDGRGYSTARLLRERYGYSGQLRAIGDVLMDQMFYMKRCGFNAFAVREDRDPSKAIEALADFKESYQAATDQPEPLFRRRLP